MKPERMLPLLYSLLLSSAVGILMPAILIFTAAPAQAEWSSQGVFAATQLLQIDYPRAAPDGQGGIVMVWDVDDSGDYSVHAGRVDAEGNRVWGDEGIAIAHFANSQLRPAIATDAAGYAYIAWRDTRAPSGIRAQKVAPDGSFLWDPNGEVVVGLGNGGSSQQLVADESGGCYVVWDEDRFGNLDIFIQRLNSSGNPYFAANGFQVVADPQIQMNPQIILDGAGGAIVAWEDMRNSFNFDIYAQSFNFLSSPVWGANGTAVATTAEDEDTPRLVTDGAAGAIVVYEKQDDVGANRINAAGSLPWGATGVYVSNELEHQTSPNAISDGAGGAIIVFNDTRDTPDANPYAQRIGSNGAALWTRGGVLLSTGVDDQWLPKVASDGAGGAIAIWNDSRPSDNSIHFYAQRMAPDGVLMWGSGGRGALVAIEPRTTVAVFPDGNGNAILAGEDHRTGAKPIVQRIDGRHGYWGRPEPIINSVNDTPGDQGGFVSVNWVPSERDQLSESLITHYSIWRATDAVPAPVAGAAPRLVTLEDMRPGFAGPAYRVSEASPGGATSGGAEPHGAAPGDFFWEYVGEQAALYASGYSFNAPTKSDAVGADPAVHYFQVVAHTNSQFISWPSVEASGSSVDNLAPAAPLLLSAQRLGGDDVLLEWSPGALEGDLSDYAVYRAGASGVIPDPLFFLSDEADTTGVDSTATASSDFYYIVTARDIHGNESTPSNEAMVDGTPTGIGDHTPALSALSVLPNVPNPFSATTTLRFGLPEASGVTLEVFDVRGRRVFTGNAGRMSAGEQSLVFDGRDQNGAALPNGVYFYRVSAAGLTQTRKMVISR